MPCKVLIVGSGGREHALARCLATSPQRPILLAAPGNPGTATLATNLPLAASKPDDLVAFCGRQGIDLVIIGPEDPLIGGLADRLRAVGCAVFGPGAAGARLEGDKEFAKQVMEDAGVPTARYRAFRDHQAALAYLETQALPVVVKACGAAQGKGVAVCTDRKQAQTHLDLCFAQGKFGAAGQRVLIEECLQGAELSVLALTDGRSHVWLAPSRDHKRIGEADRGPNTGGMGAYAPVPLPDELCGRIDREIIEPVLAALRERGIAYRGVLYAGLMLTEDGPKVLEFNCRFGDPETQVVLPLLRGDALALLLAVARGNLAAALPAVPAAGSGPSGWPGAQLTAWDRSAVVVVAAARGYPGRYAQGHTLCLPPDRGERAYIIHGATAIQAGTLVTAGGRVLGVVGTGPSLQQAREEAYGHLARVVCEDLHHRRDIAGCPLAREGASDA